MATYYISNSGFDTNDGTSEVTPWRTIEKLNTVISFNAGDSILFKCGDTWNEQLVMPSSGSVGNPIVISSYGTGAKPILSSWILTASWTLVGGGVYSTSGGIGSIYSILWEGNIAVNKASSSACSDGAWYYTGGVTYYKPSSGIPSDHGLQYVRFYAGTNNFIAGINVSGKSYITITGLQFQRCGEGITTFDTSTGTNSLVIYNCDFYYCADGILIMPDANHNTAALIHDNYFKWCKNGIRLYCSLATGVGTSTESQNRNCKIYSNEIDACGTTDGTTTWDSDYGTDYEAIGLNNIQDCEIYDNYIHGGYQIGVNVWNISTQYSRNNLIYRNHIEDNTNTPIALDSNPTSVGYSGNWIYNNLLVNCGSSSGFAFTQGLTEVGMNYFVNNTCVGDWSGFKLYTTLNVALYLTIENNIFYGTGNYYARINGVPTNLVCNYNMYKTKTGGSPYFYVNSVSLTFAQFQSSGYEANGSIDDPLFISASNYGIQSASPAKNAGVNTTLTTDYAGHTRTLPIDVGAYEYFVPSTGTTTKIKSGANFYKWNGVPLEWNP